MKSFKCVNKIITIRKQYLEPFDCVQKIINTQLIYFRLIGILETI